MPGICLVTTGHLCQAPSHSVLQTTPGLHTEAQKSYQLHDVWQWNWDLNPGTHDFTAHFVSTEACSLLGDGLLS